MNIVHIINRFLPNIGGAELYVYNLSKKLVELGHRVTVITTTSTKFRGAETRSLPKREVIDGIEVIRARAYLSGPGLVFAPSLSRLIIDNDADIYNVHGFLSNISMEASIITKSFKGKPVVLTVHDITIAENLRLYYPLWKLYFISLGELLCKVVDVIIAQNPQDASLLRSLVKDGDKVHIVPNGIDLNLFNKSKISSTDLEEFKKKFRVENKYVLLFVGRIEKRKRIDLLLFALKLIVNEFGDNIVLLVVGPDQGEKENLLKLSRQLGLEKNVIFTGLLDVYDLFKAYAIADIFVSLSAQEAFGLSILEALAMEVPVVTHRWKGISYVCKDNSGCLLVNPFDFRALANNVVLLLRNEGYRRFLGTKGRSYVVENFSLEKMVERILSIYRVLVK
jgi:glycosyltransferase involved in cell wall biosynthesis